MLTLICILILLNLVITGLCFNKIRNWKYEYSSQCRYPDTDIREAIIDVEFEKARKLAKVLDKLPSLKKSIEN